MGVNVFSDYFVSYVRVKIVKRLEDQSGKMEQHKPGSIESQEQVIIKIRGKKAFKGPKKLQRWPKKALGGDKT